VFIVVWTFRLKDDVSEADFLAANERLQTEFVYLQPGFVRRTTARGKDGEWLVIGVWGSRAEAFAAREIAKDDLVSRTANAMVEPSSVQVKRFETLD
jgi:hypothetical protein